MQSTDSKIVGSGSTSWPQCEILGDICPLGTLSEALGDGVVESLATFAIRSKPGARLVLQKNQDGFSVQVTKAVYRGTSGTEGLSSLHNLRGNLNMLLKKSNSH